MWGRREVATEFLLSASRKEPLGKPRYIWEDIIMDLGKIRVWDVNRIHLAGYCNRGQNIQGP
jgi:hypothetical protein